MRNVLASLLLLALAVPAFASVIPVPEIDGSTAAGALTLITGAAVLLRSRRKR
jgi:hypothetical protein